MAEVPAESPSGNGLPNPPFRVRAQPTTPDLPRLALGLVLVLLASLFLALHFQSFFDDAKFSGVLLSAGLRDALRRELPRELFFGPVFGVIALGSIVVWLVSGAFLSLIARTGRWAETLWATAKPFAWLDLLGVFEFLWIAGGGRAEFWLASLAALLPFFHTIAWAGFGSSMIHLFVTARAREGVSPAIPSGGATASADPSLTGTDRTSWLGRALAHPAIVWIAATVYAVVFSLLSIFQYEALMVPHGDTAMYEEHLWNVLHGKGFRSQLDEGRLFFGEHLQVIHLLFLPIYALFPSLATLNVLMSIGIGSGAIAVRGLGRRLTGSDAAANWLGIAYVLYFPLQYLSIEASLKTLRPENLGVPLLLFALWCLELGRVRSMLALMGLTLLCKEDYAIPIGMIGLYLSVWPPIQEHGTGWRSRLLGSGLVVFSVVFLWFVLAVFIPYFRGGPPHYTVYYKSLGNSPAEVIGSLLKQPELLIGRFINSSSLFFVLAMTLPLGGVPLLGVRRLWVMAPTLASILLIELKDAQTPFFHFHAPLVPIVFWAAAEGIQRLESWFVALRNRAAHTKLASQSSVVLLDRGEWSQRVARRVARFAAVCALVSGLWFGKSPLSVAFYDPHSGLLGFGRTLYGRSPRVESFERVFKLIPSDASVAATDFVRPRFTHHRMCHQYGQGGLKPHVAAVSVDYIIVDLLGPYSNWVEGQRLREIDAEPDSWELLPLDPLDRFFFVVARRRPATDSGG